MSVVPMTSAGILEFADRLHASALRMDEEVRESPVFGQSFIGPWTDFLNINPWTERPPNGLLNLVQELQSLVRVIKPIRDFQTLRAFERRLQTLWDSGKQKGHVWVEPRPENSTAGGSGPTAGASLTTLGLIVLGAWLLSKGNK